MSEREWLENKSLRQLVDELTAEIVKRYRITRSDAAEMVDESFGANQRLQEAVLASDSAAKLKRTRAFRDAAREAKKTVYYHLRTYRSDETKLTGMIDRLRQLTPGSSCAEKESAALAILQWHASTRERLDTRHEFYQRLFETVSPPRQVLDIGCGVHPLMFPFDSHWAQQLVQYFAIDENSCDMECVEEFARLQDRSKVIVARTWNIADGWDDVTDRALCIEFDLALMMKLVPVIYRQNRDLLPILCDTPAKEWLLTGSRVSLTKHVPIERRERRVLEDFVRLAGREVKHEFTVGEEFAWLVVKPD